MRISPSVDWDVILLRIEAVWRRVQQPPEKLVDYRDRISVVTWLLVFGLGLSLLYRLSTTVLTFNALGSPISISLTETSVAAAFLALLAAVGADSVVSVHPQYRELKRHRWGWNWIFWALPMALTIIATFVLPLAPTRLIQVLALLSSGGLLALSFFCLYATVESGQAGFRRARFILDALAYGSALILFLFVYQTRTRSLFSGTLVAMTATLLAAEILRTIAGRPGLVLNYSLIIGLVLGQVTWALNYWLLPGLTGGLLLLLIFYLLVGVAQQGLQDRLNRRVLLEFAIFGVVALLLIGVVGPGFG
jgi:hypothetical protein